ncbi:facilitated trehalose transporter Tret1-like isoform X2 [Homalodisca vitripennis]|uniref:facilitated trehalose transporter Tret1-like isoform X2 n=1 Tax=Homalodisca vitripennis TaxID=197043 RepID=UPI001EEA8861|nr:facilitated trehalose transporter Tret1-like isoform X2 [Homalodisca vitripennis]
MADLQYTAVDGGKCVGTNEPNTRRVHLYTSVAILNIIYVILGTTFTWSSPMLIKLQLSGADASTVASGLTVGGMVGPFMSGMLMDRLGRKGTAVIAMGLVTSSYTLLTFTRTVWILAAGRFLGGMSFAITFSAVPTYVAEISEDSVRGVLNTLNMISIASGGLLMFSVAPFVSYRLIHYIMLGICAMFFLLCPLLPESPYTLVMKNRIGKAKHVLTWLREKRPESVVETELQIIQKAVAESEAESSSVVDLFTSRGSRRAFTTCCVLFALQQLAGITVIVYYLQTIFEMTGAAISSSTSSTVVGAIKFWAGFACPLAVKNFGYKKPLIVSALGAALGMGGLGVFFSLKLNGFEVHHLNWLPIMSVIVYMSFFIAGFANIPWAMSGELFATNVKPIATCLLTVLSSFFAFLMTKLFPNMIQLFGLDYLFLACSFFNFATAAFVAFSVKDTCGLSFLEIQELMSGRKRADILLHRAQ